MDDIVEIAAWFAPSPVGPWFWARLSAWLAAGAVLAWWALRTPGEKPANPARLRATREGLADAVRKVAADDPRAAAKWALAVRALLDAVHGGKRFRSATAEEISRLCPDPDVAEFFRAAERPLYAPAGRPGAAETGALRDAALDIVERYRNR